MRCTEFSASETSRPTISPTSAGFRATERRRRIAWRSRSIVRSPTPRILAISGLLRPSATSKSTIARRISGDRFLP
jgi:hypothetical protein